MSTTTFLTINNSSKNVAKTRKSVAKSLGHGLWSVVYAAVAFSLKLRFFYFRPPEAKNRGLYHAKKPRLYDLL
jgi:hypothetical protein